MADFGRAESPPPESVLTIERILERPPQAPARKKTRTRRNVFDSPTEMPNFFVPRAVSPTSSIFLPWTSPVNHQENGNGAFNWVLPSWRLNPRHPRRRLQEDATPVSSGLVNMLRPIAPNDNSTIHEQENTAPQLHLGEPSRRRILPRDS